MIADLESENKEIEFEEFLDAITSKLGDKESKVGKYQTIYLNYHYTYNRNQNYHITYKFLILKV